MAEDLLIRADELSKTYRVSRTVTVDALRGVSFDIARGEFVAVMGHSGSGKSTLMNIIGCIDVPTGGGYSLAGHEVSGMKSKQLAHVRNETIGFVFQSFNLLPMLSSWENVALPLVYAKEKVNRKKVSCDMMERVGLGRYVKHKPVQLSGGQRQRVAIARALVNDPDLILADEPTGNLDWNTGMEILDIFKDLNRQGRTVVMVTHEEEIGRMTDRIIRLKDGVIVSDEPAGGADV